MKRNWDLIRWLLNEVESFDGGHPILISNGVEYSSTHYKLDIGERSFGEVYEHALLLGDAGLAEVRDLGRQYDGPVGVAVNRLTMQGHDFLDAARDNSRWHQAMRMINEKGGVVGVGVLIQILSALAKQSFRLE